MNLPREIRLSQNYPNPLNPSTSFDLDLPHAGFVTINIYNELGQLVDKAIDGSLAAGHHRINWTPRNLSSGVYYYQLSLDNDASFSKKMLLIK